MGKESTDPAYKKLKDELNKWSGLNNLDLASVVSTKKNYLWRKLIKIFEFYFISKRSRFITFVQADIKSERNLALESSEA